MTHSEICPSLLTFKPKPDTPTLRTKVLPPVVESISSQKSQLTASLLLLVIV